MWGKAQKIGDIKLFENYSKMSHLKFSILAFSPIFVLFKVTCLVTLYDRKLQVFKNSSKWTILGIFNEFLPTQNVAPNVVFKLFSFGIFHQFLSFFKLTWLVTLLKSKLYISNSCFRPNILLYRGVSAPDVQTGFGYFWSDCKTVVLCCFEK